MSLRIAQLKSSFSLNPSSPPGFAVVRTTALPPGSRGCAGRRIARQRVHRRENGLGALAGECAARQASHSGSVTVGVY